MALAHPPSPKKAGVAGLIVALGAVVAGCALAFDFDGFHTDDAGSDAATSPPAEASTGSEICSNGVDDDGDGLADCADPKCQTAGYACRSLPEGWQGPFAFASGTNPPACAAPFEEADLHAGFDLVVPPPTCTCTCGPPKSWSCAASFTAANACGGGPVHTLSTNCLRISGATGTLVTASAVSGGGAACDPSAEPFAPATWRQTVRVCKTSPAAAGSCVGAAACAPPAPAGFSSGHCIARDGDLACPDGYPTKSLAYRSFTDARRCDGCACKAPCPTNVIVYAGSDCTGGAVLAATTCGNANGVGSAKIGQTLATTCTPSGGVPSGTATAANPVTFCCSP